MKLNLMGFNITKENQYRNEITSYNVTTCYNNINNNPFFTMCYSNDSEYIMKEDCTDDKIDDHDIENYKMKRWLFKSSGYSNFYALDRSNYLYPFEAKHRYHISIQNYFKDSRNEGGLFIVTERKIGNPLFGELNNKTHLPTTFRNVANGRNYKIGVSGNLIDTYTNDICRFKEELSRNVKMRSWREVINHYVSRPELLSGNPDSDIEALKKVHGIFSANIPGGDYMVNEKGHVKNNRVSENTLTFIEVEFIPFSKLKEKLYLPEHDLYIIPEDQLTDDVVHPYSKEGLERKKFEDSLKEENGFTGENKFEVTIYSQSHWLNNMCFFLNVLGDETTIVPKKEDGQGKTNYILVKRLIKGIPVTKEYDLSYENLKLLGISLNQSFMDKEREKEKIESDKVQLELNKVSLAMKELEFKRQELEVTKSLRFQELETKKSNLKSELTLQENKVKYEMFKMEKDIEAKTIELEHKKILIDKMQETEQIKAEIEQLKYKKEKYGSFVSTIGNSIKLLDNLEFFVSKYILKV